MEEQKSNTFDKDRTSFGTDGSVNEYCIDKSEMLSFKIKCEKS